MDGGVDTRAGCTSAWDGTQRINRAPVLLEFMRSGIVGIYCSNSIVIILLHSPLHPDD